MSETEGRSPRARTDLVTEPLGDELIVFDATRNRAHSLNATASAVWNACDGTRTPEQIAQHCGLEPVAVQLALDNLADARLLRDFAPARERVSRRTAIRRIAVAGAGLGIALPVIRSVVAPSAAAAGSRQGQLCNEPNSCGPSSYCAMGSVCRPGHSASHGASAPCVTGSECTYNSDCVSGHCRADSG